MINGKTIAFRGALWTLIETVGSNGLLFIVGIVLARLLDPEDFGKMGMVAILISLGTVLVDNGLSVALIRKKDCTAADFDTVFIVNVVFALFLYFALHQGAPWIAKFFGDPSLLTIIRVLGLILVIDSMAIIQRVQLTKHFEFRKLTIASLVAALASAVVGIALAVQGWGVWSLVFQVVAKQSILLIALLGLSKWTPRFAFSAEVFKTLSKFSISLLFSSLILAIQNNIYYLVIGRWFSASTLGFYTRAEQFNSIVTANINAPIEKVTLPVLANVNGDLALKAGFSKLLKTSFFVTAFGLLFMAAIAKPLILVVIGDKWYPSIVYLQLLCFSSIFFPLNSLNLNILKVKGRSDLILRTQILKTALLAVNVIAGILWGMTALLYFRLLIAVVGFLINAYYAKILVDYSLTDQIKDVLPSFVRVIAVVLPVYLISLSNIEHVALLSLQFVFGSILFFLIFERSSIREYDELKKLFRHLLITKFPNLSKSLR